MIIGMIGLGLMGEGISKRLVETGHAVAGYDIVADKLAAAVARGVKACASPAEIDTTKRVAAALTTTSGMDFVDAPVSGGPDAAAAGTLAIMAGGTEAA